MRISEGLYLLLGVACLVIACGPTRASEQTDPANRIRQAAGGEDIPTNLVVTITTRGIGRSISGSEGWRFTPTNVTQFAWRQQDDKKWCQETVVTTNVNVMGTVCRVLTEGGYLGLTNGVSGRSSGAFFPATPYIGGERHITVAMGDEKLDVQRSCWRATRGDDGSAERFSALYDTLKGLAPSPTPAISAAIESGAAGKPTPDDFAVQIETFGVKANAPRRATVEDILSESWRVTPKLVETYNCNVVDKTRLCTPEELQAVCRALKKHGFVELAATPRTEPDAKQWVFDGTSFRSGWRCIRVTANGQNHTIGEGATWGTYRNPAHAQRMHSLYDAIREETGFRRRTREVK